MDLVHGRNDGLFDGFPGIGLVRAFEKLRHWLREKNLCAGELLPAL